MSTTTRHRGGGACDPVATLKFELKRTLLDSRVLRHRVVADKRTLEASDLHGQGWGNPGSLQGLLEKYAPYIRLNAGERYEPIRIEVSLYGASLRTNSVPAWQDDNPIYHWPPPFHIAELSSSDLARYSWAGFSIDLPCSELNPDGCHQAYETALGATSNPHVVYATAVRGDDAHVVLQYHMHYYFNDNETVRCEFPWDSVRQVHEGDWEHISVLLDRNLIPMGVSYPAHGKYNVRLWSQVETVQGTSNPVLYVSKGGHGSYPTSGRTCFRPRWYSGKWADYHFGDGLHFAPSSLPGSHQNRYQIVQVPRWNDLPSIGAEHDWLQFSGFWGTGVFYHREGDIPGERLWPPIPTPIYPGPAFRHSWADPVGEAFANLRFNAACPVDILVRDPLGREIGPEVNTIPRARYEVWQADSTDVNAGRSANVIIPYPVAGQYHVEVTLLNGADPDQTYTLWSTRNWIGAETDTIHLAEDVPVVEIPSEGYYVIPDVPFVGHSEVSPDTWMADWDIDDSHPVEWRLTSPDGVFSVHDLDWGSLLLNDEVVPFSVEADTTEAGVSLVLLFARGEASQSVPNAEPGTRRRVKVAGVFQDPEFRLEAIAYVEIRARVPFIRGDIDGSGEINISDPIYSLAYQFAGGPPPPCMMAADDDGSGEVNISDPIYSLHYQFDDGPPPAGPFPECGLEPIASGLSCDSFAPCGAGFRRGPEPVVHEAGLWDFLLRAPDVWNEDSLRVELSVVTAEPVVGFEALFTYDTRSLEFVGIEKAGAGESMQFLAAREDLDLGGTRLGAVKDFGLSALLESGVHRLGSLVFTRREAGGGGAPMSPSRTVALKSARFVLEDLQAIVIGEGGGSTELPASVEEWDGEGASEARRPPASLTLLPAVPNPATGFTRLEFGMPAAGAATLSIYDVAGREVRRLGSGEHQPGWHSVIWDGRGDDGRRLSQGVYFARLRAGSEVRTERVTLIR